MSKTLVFALLRLQVHCRCIPLATLIYCNHRCHSPTTITTLSLVSFQHIKVRKGMFNTQAPTAYKGSYTMQTTNTWLPESKTCAESCSPFWFLHHHTMEEAVPVTLEYTCLCVYKRLHSCSQCPRTTYSYIF